MENEEQKDYGQILVQWNFPEFVKQKRGKGWYFMLGLVFILLLIYAFTQTNFLFAIIVIMGAIVLYLNFRREPNQVSFKIAEDGIESDGRFFTYDQIRNFFIIYQPPEVNYLFFEFKSLSKPRLHIPLSDQSPTEVRNILTTYLEEDLEREDEPFTNALGRLLKL